MSVMYSRQTAWRPGSRLCIPNPTWDYEIKTCLSMHACILSLFSCHPCFHSKGTFVALWVEWNGKHSSWISTFTSFWSILTREKSWSIFPRLHFDCYSLSQTPLPFATRRTKWKWAQHKLSQLPEKARPVMPSGGGGREVETRSRTEEHHPHREGEGGGHRGPEYTNTRTCRIFTQWPSKDPSLLDLFSPLPEN